MEYPKKTSRKGGAGWITIKHAPLRLREKQKSAYLPPLRGKQFDLGPVIVSAIPDVELFNGLLRRLRGVSLFAFTFRTTN